MWYSVSDIRLLTIVAEHEEDEYQAELAVPKSIKIKFAS